MLVRSAIVILLALNLGAAGWWVFQPTHAPRQDALHAPTLRLLSEPPLEKSTVAAEVDVPVDESEPTLEPEPEPAQPPTPEPAPEAPPVAAICLRFGPFSEERARASVRQALLAADSRVNAHGTPAVAARSWKVFLPAQASREAALAQAERLKTAGVQDLFVMNNGAEANSIALGRFSSEAGAHRRLAELKGKGFTAQLEPIGGSAAQLWLDARLAQPDARDSLAQLAPAQPLDCKQMR